MANVKVIIEEITKNGGSISDEAKKIQSSMDLIEKSAKEAGVSQSAYQQALSNATKQQENQQSALDRLHGSYTEFQSALGLVQQGLQYVQVGLDATVGKTVEYANEVRTLGQINKQSAESNSRLIQVLDDYKISIDDIITASRKLKDNGLTPNIETIAKLAEQYQKIQDPAKQLDFAQKNLGRATKDWLEVLSQSPETLRKQAAGINQNLILTQKQIDAARRLELSQDSLKDAQEGLAITWGNKIIPLETRVVDGFNVYIRALEIMKEKSDGGRFSSISFGEALDQAGAAIYQEQQAMLANKDAADQMAQGQQDAEQAAKDLSNTFTGLISSMFAIQKGQEDYQNTVDAANKKQGELATQKLQLINEMEHERAIGKLTNDEYDKYIQKIQEIDKAQGEAASTKSKADADLSKASNQRVFDLVQQKLGADGVVTSGEYEYEQRLAVQLGLVSQASADAAIAENKRADAMVMGFEQTLPPMQRSLQLMQQIAAYNGTRVQFGIDFMNTLNGSIVGSSTTGGSNSGSGTGGSSTPKRDSGGWGMAGQSYYIGTGAQPEVFTPSQNGYFTPADKAGSKTVNVTLNIGAMNNRQDIDYLKQEIVKLMATV